MWEPFLHSFTGNLQLQDTNAAEDGKGSRDFVHPYRVGENPKEILHSQTIISLLILDTARFPSMKYIPIQTLRERNPSKVEVVIAIFLKNDY